MAIACFLDSLNNFGKKYPIVKLATFKVITAKPTCSRESPIFVLSFITTPMIRVNRKIAGTIFPYFSNNSEKKTIG